MAQASQYLEQEKRFSGRYGKTVFDTLYLSYRPMLSQGLWFLAVGLLGRGLLLANANIIGYWVDSFCNPSQAVCRPPPTWLQGRNSHQYLVLLSMMTAVGFVGTLFFRTGISRLSVRAVSLLYDETTLRTSRFPIRFYDTTPAGRIITRFSSDYSNVFRLFGGPLADFIGLIFELICMLVLITLASPYYLMVSVVVGALNYVVYRLNRENFRRERRELAASRSPSIAHFAETAQGSSTIRTFLRQRSFHTRFSKLNDWYLNQRLRTVRYILAFSFEMNGLTAVLLFLTGVTGYELVKHGLASVGSVGVAFTFITLSGNTLTLFFDWLAQFEEALTGVERLDDYLRHPIEPGASLPSCTTFATGHARYTPEAERAAQAPSALATRSARVRLDHVWFRYRFDLPYVLKGLDLEIRPGEHLGIVGRTGSGKSSLIQALFYLYPIDQGRILINDLEPAIDDADRGLKLDLTAYRRAVAWIPQDPVLLRGTLRENLCLTELVAATDAGPSRREQDEQLIRVLDRVGLRHWFRNLPDGLDSPIEERGRNLSQGERQLVCMARCLLQDAPVIVMDEATSAVDPQSEEIMVRATQEFFADRTQIIVAHRLSTLFHCHRILWLQNGEVKMLGTPQEVLPIFEKSQLTI